MRTWYQAYMPDGKVFGFYIEDEIAYIKYPGFNSVIWVNVLRELFTKDGIKAVKICEQHVLN